jgi:hypothetical protein
MTSICKSIATFRFFIALTLMAAAANNANTSYAAESPESVLVIFRVKRGKADELQQLLWRSWATYERLELVLPQPHIAARSNEDNGEVTFFELFSWKSHGVPDSAPNEVRNLWSQMEALCEPRNGESGINIVEIDILNPQHGGGKTQ